MPEKLKSFGNGSERVIVISDVERAKGRNDLNVQLKLICGASMIDLGQFFYEMQGKKDAELLAKRLDSIADELTAVATRIRSKLY